ncbi:MAG: penicillin-binding transpeptidase domain-containing protein, partial [Patescibacteria group bacterium]|nr:penicillin-binding transpeptidase domain-containing protein [Patescibacteria group bacterium]
MKNWRINIVFVFLILFSAAIIDRLIFLQVSNGEIYRALSQGLHSSFLELPGSRGEIFLKNGEPLAINIDLPFVFVDPTRVKDQEEVARSLAPILNLEEVFVLDKLNKHGSYSLIKRKLSQQEVESLRNLDLEGVFVGKEKGRYYPKEVLASHVIGFLGAGGEGQYGLEQFYDSTLRSEKGFIKEKKGADLILTINYDIQFEAEKLLQKAKENLDIEKGQIIVLDPDSGKILAMADLLNFNPNNYEKYAEEGNLEIFKNRATQGLFEPGSVFKTITMSAALEEKRISPKMTYIDQGSVTIDGETIYNYNERIYGEQSMTNVLEKSINTGSVFVQKQLGQALFLKYMKDFGLFEPTGIDTQETY